MNIHRGESRTCDKQPATQKPGEDIALINCITRRLYELDTRNLDLVYAFIKGLTSEA